MKKLFILLIATIAGFTTAMAQNAPEITFDNLAHDFGTFPEEAGKVSHTFEFTNTGKSDLILQNVRASCGCTTPEWTKTPVKPGEKGVVTATYNPAGRPGAFTKSITVSTNAGDQRLTIKGQVTPKPPKVENQYPFDINGFRLKNQTLYLRNINYPEKKTESLEVINTTNAPINISFKNVPDYLTVKAPSSLKPNETGQIEITFDSKSAKEWGSVNSEFYVVLNGKFVEDNKYKITVISTITENFNNMSAQEKADAPVATVGNKIDIGKIKANSKKTVKFAISNDGKNELHIRKGDSNKKEIKVIVPSNGIKAGKKNDIKVEINSANMKPGKFTGYIYLITNDPNRSNIAIQVEGEIEAQ
jgi:hypothetical protein